MKLEEFIKTLTEAARTCAYCKRQFASARGVRTHIRWRHWPPPFIPLGNSKNKSNGGDR